MIQTGLIQSTHNDILTDVAYDFYGLRLATCSLDQRIKVWQVDESNGNWNVEDDWKAHDATVSKLSWAHPEFGTILASASFDRTVKIWEQTSFASITDSQTNGAGAGSPQAASCGSSRWVERDVLVDARGIVRVVEFAPHHLGLKLATVSSDNHVRIYECLEHSSLATWQLSEEVDVSTLPSASLSSSYSVAFATPTQTSATLEGASATLVAQALQQSQNPATQGRPGMGNREADGGWCISCVKIDMGGGDHRGWLWGIWRYQSIDTLHFHGIAHSESQIIQLSPSRRPITLLTFDPSPSPAGLPTEAGTSLASDGDTPTPFAITSVAWAPSCGRSYHLIATGGHDGHVRIWRVKPAEEEPEVEGEGGDPKRSANVVADFDHHKSAVGRVEWHITGTVLSSAGNDGRVRLWKATIGNVWRTAGSIGVEQSENTQDADVNMGPNAIVASNRYRVFYPDTISVIMTGFEGHPVYYPHASVE
ncbi:WD40-repeat-containing domain protein [Suillus fuscotomentosus]|uniref:WD40-repeat-containing domain protein n=1 Tax=Suillus fuscotomentosus TaxID=1912939 RepID=A0AAD4DTB7_9AGAM|nr:WD40-repeat-containing domain protein [Suillus fuscotomentosus]KAG1893575.1 WD40-repeat-containing domain protein [Suillus fuscotomentosus]